MNYEKYDQAIIQTDTELKRIISVADGLIIEFKQVIPTYLSDWSDYLVNRAIKNKPDRISEMSTEDLARIKQQLREYQQSVADFINRRLETVRWAHKEKIDEKQRDRDVVFHLALIKQTNNSLDGVIRESIGNIGKLLIDNGLIEKPGENTEWKIKGSTVIYAYGLFTYPGLQPSSDKLQGLRIRYGEIIDGYLSALAAKKKAENEKSVAQAEEKWKSV